ncbi:MAG TPA: hypothetical protein VF556_08550 [Pyrinomonadaceae bacterium]
MPKLLGRYMPDDSLAEEHIRKGDLLIYREVEENETIPPIALCVFKMPDGLLIDRRDKQIAEIIGVVVRLERDLD